MQHQHNAAKVYQSMISGRRVVVNGGNFTQHFTSGGRKSSFEILQENVAHTAFHNSAARFDPPKCHPNTRVAVLKKLMDWIHRTDWETWYRYILWLTGAAGAGKSAISQSIIEICLLEGLVIASFVFFRSDSTRNHSKSLVATLAYQIFFSVPSTQAIIQAAIKNDPLIFTRSLEHQFDLLVVQPLRKFYKPLDTLEEKWRRLIVIDGLDECLDHASQRQILNMFRDAIRKYELPIIFLVASRPEHDINTTFGSKHMDGAFARLYLDETYEPDQDIRRFLKDSFEEIRTNHPYKSRIPMVWPTPEATESIVRKSSGQFVYAATVVRYVHSIRHQPRDRLEKILNLRPLQGDMPFAQLDELYTMILSCAADIERVLFAISVYSLRIENYGGLDLLRYMLLDKEEIEILFCDLGALVSVEWDEEDKTTGLKILHASLHDFLLDPMRSKHFYISLDAYRTKHMFAILQYITPKLRESDDPDFKDELDFDEMESHVLSTKIFFRENFANCEITADILHQTFNFPFAQALNQELDVWYLEVIEFLCLSFFPFIRRMARLDAQYSFIEAHTQDAFDGFFLSKFRWYHEKDDFIAGVCLIYHLGQVEFVPNIMDGEGSYALQVLNSLTNLEKNWLLLDVIDPEPIGADEDGYRQCLLAFLQDPRRSGKYAIGPHAYTKATSFFMKELSKLYPPFGEEESVFAGKITFHDNIWTLNTFGVAIDVDIFLILGYIIFFLPQCSKSKRLVKHCKQQSFLTQGLIKSFPERTALVRQAMQDYLERVGTECPSEFGEDSDDWSDMEEESDDSSDMEEESDDSSDTE